MGLDSSIIQNPKAWEASGHLDGFSDPMVDCRETKARYRADHLQVLSGGADGPYFAFVEGEPAPALKRAKKILKRKVALEGV